MVDHSFEDHDDEEIVGGTNNPWNAFQSAFTEQPFDVYAMTRGQVAMLYYTMKDHLVRHVDALTARPTGSLWDYVPEPRLQTAPPQINDANLGRGNSKSEQQASSDIADSIDEDRDEVVDIFRCLVCGQFMHKDEEYLCMDCAARPFHLPCLELHRSQAHPRSHPADEEKERAEEKEILQKEADAARSQWVDQMDKLSKTAMPLSHKIASILVVLVAVGLVAEPLWSPAAVDEPVPFPQ